MEIVIWYLWIVYVVVIATVIGMGIALGFAVRDIIREKLKIRNRKKKLLKGDKKWREKPTQIRQ